MFNSRHSEQIRSTLQKHVRQDRQLDFIAAVSRLLESEPQARANRKRPLKGRGDEVKVAEEGVEDLGEAMPANLSADSLQERRTPAFLNDEVASALMHAQPVSEELSFAASTAATKTDGNRSEIEASGPKGKKRQKLPATREDFPDVTLPKDDIDDIFSGFG